MIARIRGELLERELEEVVVDTGGVGYQLFVSSNTLALLGPVGSQVDLHVHTQLREDSLTLFGFATADERDAFRRLTTVSGVGPKLARSVLSVFRPDELSRAIRGEEVRTLSRAPGVGKRTAERMVVELKESIPPYAAPRNATGAAGAAGAPGEEAQAAPTATPAGGEPASPSRVELLADLEKALGFMGYKGAQIQRVLAQLEPRALGRPLEELIRDALSLLRGGKP